MSDEQEKALARQSSGYLEAARALPVITSAAKYEDVGERLKMVRALQRQIVDFFKPIKQKMDAAKKEVLNKEKESLAPTKEAQGIYEHMMGVWIDKQEKKRLASEARLAEQARERAEELGVDEEEVPVVQARTKKPKVEGISSRDVAKFKIIDPSKIERRFLIPDEKKIGQVVRSTGNDAEDIVGGIEVYFEKSFRVSS